MRLYLLVVVIVRFFFRFYLFLLSCCCCNFPELGAVDCFSITDVYPVFQYFLRVLLGLPRYSAREHGQNIVLLSTFVLCCCSSFVAFLILLLCRHFTDWRNFVSGDSVSPKSLSWGSTVQIHTTNWGPPVSCNTCLLYTSNNLYF